MTATFLDVSLQPGDLAVLMAAAGLDVSSDSPLADSPLLARAIPARPRAEIAAGVDTGELTAALRALAMPSQVIAGLRGARRMEPWSFVLCRGSSGACVMLADEGGGCARLRFPYSDAALVDWLAGPFRRFAAPEIPCVEIPALAPSGMAVMLALMDVFRDRYPDLDPDWNATAPVTFTAAEVLDKLAASVDGREPSSNVNALTQLGGPKAEALSLETVEALLFMFSNEGYLEMDVTASMPEFTMAEAFLGTPMSLAWWDMSFALESRLDGSLEPLRVVQGLALWRFSTGSDNRTTMRAVSGQAIEVEIRALVAAPISSRCPSCGEALGPKALFCRHCGGRTSLRTT